MTGAAPGGRGELAKLPGGAAAAGRTRPGRPPVTAPNVGPAIGVGRAGARRAAITPASMPSQGS